MTVSIFTPSHDNSYLREVYASIKDQPFHEWIIVHNNGGEPIEFNDPRVKQFILYKSQPWVGALKRYACAQATGEILLELDHDDRLLPGAIEEVQQAFRKQSVGFVYSNTIRTDGTGAPQPRFSETFGWRYRDTPHGLETIHFSPLPTSVSRIWYAPDHLRAFRRDLYNQVGGYNPEMRVLDDLDLMCRLYCVTTFHHIDKPLYHYRVTGQNSWLKHNEEIQANVLRIHEQYIPQMALAWARNHALHALDLGSRLTCERGYTSVDLKDAEVIADLNKRWPWKSGSVGVVIANDIFEHLRNPLFTMRELHRVLAPGGVALIQVPSTDGRGAFQDPTHVSFWNENSFLYYTHSAWARYIDTPVRFQAVLNYTTAPNEQRVCWTRAHLVKLHEGVDIPGPILV